MQRTGQTLPCQAPSRPSYIPGHSSLNRRCNTRTCFERVASPLLVGARAMLPVKQPLKQSPTRVCSHKAP